MRPELFVRAFGDMPSYFSWLIFMINYLNSQVVVPGINMVCHYIIHGSTLVSHGYLICKWHAIF